MHDSIEAAVIEYVTQDVAEMPDAIGEQAEEVDMHVMLDGGQWHREMDFKSTACDRPIDRFVLWRRSRQYDASHGAYCPICFTPREIAEAVATAAVQKEIEAEVHEERMATLSDGSWKRRAEAVPDAMHHSRKRTERISERMQRLLKPEEKKP